MGRRRDVQEMDQIGVEDGALESPRYGQKGGDGPNRGKVASTYEFVAPDGKVIRRKNFNIHQGVVYATLSQMDGEWKFPHIFATQSEAQARRDEIAGFFAREKAQFDRTSQDTAVVVAGTRI